MTTTAFKQPEPGRRPGRAALAGRRRRPFEYEGEELPDLRRPDRRVDPPADPRRAGARVERVHRPDRPGGRHDSCGRAAGGRSSRPGRSTRRSRTSRPPGTQIEFPQLLRNTVAHRDREHDRGGRLVDPRGLRVRRFRFPGTNGLFLVLLATIILPLQVTLSRPTSCSPGSGWTGTWLPLIVPHFFANAYNVFLLRQYFLTIPRDLDEAAMIDGAGPFRILRSVIVPQAIAGDRGRHACSTSSSPGTSSCSRSCTSAATPTSAAVARHAAVQRAVRDAADRSSRPARILAMAVPVVVFFLAQRAFMRGVVVTGVEK